MSINVAFLTLLLLMMIYITFIEIFTVVFMLTGMSHTRARFQVISLLTSCGFTTSESEIVVSSRKRRKVAITIMIFGNMFNVAVVSLLVNTMMSFSKRRSFDVLQATLLLLAFVVFIATIKRVPWVRVTFDKLVKRVATKVMFSKNSNPLLVLDNFHGFVIAEVKVIEVPEKLRNRTLLEAGISKENNILILTIKRDDETIRDVTKDEIILKNDRLIIYGPLTHIIEVFGQRPSYYNGRQ